MMLAATRAAVVARPGPQAAGSNAPRRSLPRGSSSSSKTTTTASHAVVGGFSASARVGGGGAAAAAASALLRRGTSSRRRRGGRGGGGVAYAIFGGAPPANPGALLKEGKELYASGERMQGMKLFERALRTETIALETRQELLYCCMCCHAAFGDVETAKQYLRDMNLYGLPFELAMMDPSFMRLESHAQMRNQLKKFAAGELKSQGTVQREIFNATRGGAAGGIGNSGEKKQKMGDMDLGNLEISGDTDETVEAIAKRVGGLIALSILGFVGLYTAGLQFLR